MTPKTTPCSSSSRDSAIGRILLFQHSGIDFAMQFEECDPSIIGSHPFKKKKGGNHPTRLPTTRCCPRFPCAIEQTCQPRQPNFIQGLQYLKVNLSTPGALPLVSFLTTSVPSAREMGHGPGPPTLPLLVQVCPPV